MATAAEQFWRHSFHGVSVDLVADAAGVNKATVYRYFADKRDLALAVVKYNGALSLELIFESTFDEYVLPQDRLASIYSYAYGVHLATYKTDGDVFGCPIVGLALELGQEMPEIRAEAQAVFDQVEGYLTKIASDAIAARAVKGDPDALGRTLTQLLHGAFASARVASDPARLLDAGHASLALIGFPEKRLPEQEPPA
ncbi:TetR/AcrR family transcriptional regulator [Erythrobacter sp. GH1-10]|uniref:TetR/AcrR family transcriptional regulator n=1 Tax=Erythrobacter sp. GH1-10 TaxID=3349334 RepID=UPI0038781D45